MSDSALLTIFKSAYIVLSVLFLGGCAAGLYWVFQQYGVGFLYGAGFGVLVFNVAYYAKNKKLPDYY